jgi:tetratricopeptide (TPR) repeat protein
MRTKNLIKILFLVCFLSVNFVYVLVPIRAAEKPNLIGDTKTEDEKFDRIFREGRELMDKEEWAKATAKFNEIACDCPENKRVDAALYWLAYCYKKQKMYKETNATVERLLKSFPNSEWANDAQILRIETTTNVWATSSGGNGQNITGTTRPAVTRAVRSAQAPNFPTNIAVAEGFYQDETKLEREDELRLAAFQSLLAADPKKGIETLGRVLATDSKASETLKREMLRSFRANRFIYQSFPGFGTTELTPSIIVTQINPILRETLVKGYQTESNLKIRNQIIYTIANINDEPSYTYLAQLYPTESNKDLKKAIINAFGGTTHTLAGFAYNSSKVVDLYNRAATEVTAASGTGQSFSTTNTTPKTNPVRELRFNKLMEIFRIEKEQELRRLAFSNIQRFAGWSNKEGMVDSLSQLYDSEGDENFKISIINSFGNLPKNTQATNKLISIAKSDKSDKMRLEAIRALRNNKSPEVIKFLEDLIQ